MQLCLCWNCRLSRFAWDVTNTIASSWCTCSSCSALWCGHTDLANRVEAIGVTSSRRHWACSNRVFILVISLSSSCGLGSMHWLGSRWKQHVWHLSVLRIEMVLLLVDFGSGDCVPLGSSERINHIDLFLLDATDPLTVRDDVVWEVRLAHCVSWRYF